MTTYAAAHKEFGGGCPGYLSLSSAGLHFSCQTQPDLDFPISTIDGLDQDGILVNENGKKKKYHFVVFNAAGGKANKELVESLLDSWWKQVNPQR